MSAETGALATTPHPLGKPGGPGLFHDRSLSLPPYVQNIAHSLMTKRGMDKSKAIQVALGTVKNWASGQGDVKPEVRAAAAGALAQWEAAKAKAKATPNKDAVSLSQPMALLRGVLDGPSAIDLAREPDQAPAKSAHKPKAKHKDADEKHGKHKLPPGAVGWKHNWVPVDKNGNPVGPSQKDKSAAEINDMAGHTDATKDAIKQAYANKATADAKKAATKAASTAKAASRKAEAAKKRAAAEAKRRAKAKEAAKKKAAAEAKRKAAAAAKKKAAKIKAHQKLVADATKQALADKKAGRSLTPTQDRLLEVYEKQQRALRGKLRHDVTLAQPATFGSGPAEAATVPTVSSQDGGRVTVNMLKDSVPRRVLADAAKKAQKTRRDRRRKGGK